MEKKRQTYLHSGLDEVQTHGQCLPHEDVRVVTGFECFFEFFQLPAVEVGASATSFGVGILVRRGSSVRRLTAPTAGCTLDAGGSVAATADDSVRSLADDDGGDRRAAASATAGTGSLMINGSG